MSSRHLRTLTVQVCYCCVDLSTLFQAECLQQFHAFVNSEIIGPCTKHDVPRHSDAIIEPKIENPCGFRMESKITGHSRADASSRLSDYVSFRRSTITPSVESTQKELLLNKAGSSAPQCPAVAHLGIPDMGDRSTYIPERTAWKFTGCEAAILKGRTT